VLRGYLLQLLLTAKEGNNNDSHADMFLQLHCRLDLIFFLKICQVLTNDAADLATHCQLIAIFPVFCIGSSINGQCSISGVSIQFCCVHFK